MTEPKRNTPEEQNQSTHPPGWPGIPGRSQEHERVPDTRRGSSEEAEVTKQQRELEKEAPSSS